MPSGGHEEGPLNDAILVFSWPPNNLICVISCNSTVIHVSLNDGEIPDGDEDADADGGDVGEVRGVNLLQQVLTLGTAVFQRARVGRYEQ